MLKQTVINNVAPGTAASLTLARTAAPNPSVPRFAIRGVVHTNPTPPTAGTGSCTVKTTLEIYNDDTGNTQLVTSDVQSINVGVIPLVFAGQR